MGGGHDEEEEAERRGKWRRMSRLDERDVEPLGAGRGRMMAESKGPPPIYGASKPARAPASALRPCVLPPPLSLRPRIPVILPHIYSLAIYIQ